MSEHDSVFWQSDNEYRNLVIDYESSLRVTFTNPVVQHFGRWPKTNPRKMEYHGGSI